MDSLRHSRLHRWWSVRRRELEKWCYRSILSTRSTRYSFLQKDCFYPRGSSRWNPRLLLTRLCTYPDQRTSRTHYQSDVERTALLCSLQICESITSRGLSSKYSQCKCAWLLQRSLCWSYFFRWIWKLWPCCFIHPVAVLARGYPVRHPKYCVDSRNSSEVWLCSKRSAVARWNVSRQHGSLL